MSGFIFNIFDYIKNQYENDKSYGLTLIIIAVICCLIFLIFFVKPIILSCIDWHNVVVLHKQEMNNKKDDVKYISNKTGEIINLSIDEMNKRRQKNINNEEEFKKIVKESINIKED